MVYSETRYVRSSDVTGWFVGIVVALALMCIGYLVFSANPTPPTPPLTPAFVQIDIPDGHGSATHIGNGLYVTAAHVVEDHATVTINGVESAVLWSNAKYDIALVDGPDTADHVPLWCGTLSIGDTGIAHGNPTEFSNISMTGTVAGDVTKIGKWEKAIPVDVSMAPGMSGGGFIVGGVLAGVNVGVALTPTGPISSSLFGLSIVVPSQVVCDLMGRS